MSVPSYIINWDEFAIELGKGITIENVDIDNSGIESLLAIHFPGIINLLKNIRDEIYLMKTEYDNYNQKIKGFSKQINSSIEIFEFIPEKDIFITGISFSYNHLEGLDDYFNLSIENKEAELIFSEVYLKDTLQHKHFNKFFPVPAGTKIKITHYNQNNKPKHIWYDLEFLEHKQVI